MADKVPVKQVEKTMTTKELAETLGVTTRTVQNVVDKLGLAKVLSQVSINGKMGYIFTEQQATVIKQEIQKHHNLASRQIDTVTTEQEENDTIIKAMSILQMRAQAYKDRAEYAEAKLVEQQPKVDYYDAIISSGDAIDMGAVAKTIGVMGRNKLFEFLRDKCVLDKNNIPYQRFVDAGYFKTVECKYTVGDDTRIAIKTVVFQKGVEFIRDLVKGVKDE